MKTELTPLTRELLETVLENAAAPSLRDPALRGRFITQATEPLADYTYPIAWAFRVEEKPLAAFGVLPHWPGRAEGWMVFSATARRRVRAIAARTANRWLDELQRDPAWRRVEMWVRANEPWALTFAKALNAPVEALARAWGPDGSDFLLLARIAERAS